MDRRDTADVYWSQGLLVVLGAATGVLLCWAGLGPDFVPVLGFADDAIVVVIALRSVARRAGSNALDRRWPGTPEGLTAVRALAGVPTHGGP